MFFLTFIIIFSLLVWIFNYFKTDAVKVEEPNLHEIWEFTKHYGGNHTSHLNLLNDKLFYWAQHKQVLISYQKVGRTLFVLGDPIGDEQQIPNAILEFELHCRSIRKRAVYYQVSSRFLSDFQRHNNQFIKLGDEAKLSLLNYSLEGKKGAKLRTRKNKFERNGYHFKVLNPQHSKKLLDEIGVISESWLGSRKEKGYSVGYFCKNYISRFPLGVLYNSEGKVIAFASLACNFKELDRTITIDLMRYHKDSPHGTMDMLFLSIFNWCKEQGYEWCSMGMSPLANLNTEEISNKFEKIGQLIFHKGNHLYNFKGLYEYKNKFQPEWESRYLVYRKGYLPILIIQLIWLIHRKPIPIVKIKKFHLIKKILNKAG